MNTENYFYQFEFDLLNLSEKKILEDYVIKEKNKFTLGVVPQGGEVKKGYENYYSNNASLQISNETPIEIFNLVKNINKIFKFTNGYKFVGQDIKTDVLRHKDKRQFVIIIPITPYDNFSPTLFWKDYESNSPIAKCDYFMHRPAIINSKFLHSVKNTSDTFRIGLQYYDTSLNIDYYQAKEMIKNNKIFKKLTK